MNGGVPEGRCGFVDIDTRTGCVGPVANHHVVDHLCVAVVYIQSAAIARRSDGGAVVPNDVAVQDGIATLLEAHPAAVVCRVAVDDIAVQSGAAVVQAHPSASRIGSVAVNIIVAQATIAVPKIHPAAIHCRVAEHLIIGQDGRSSDDVHSTTSIQFPVPSAQPAGVSAGDAQALDRGADGAGDVDRPPLPLGIQCGGVGLRIGRRPVGGRVTAAQRDGLADVDSLGQTGAVLYPGAVPGHLYHVSLTSRVHRRLDGGVGETRSARDLGVAALGRSSLILVRAQIGASIAGLCVYVKAHTRDHALVNGERALRQVIAIGGKGRRAGVVAGGDDVAAVIRAVGVPQRTVERGLVAICDRDAHRLAGQDGIGQSDRTPRDVDSAAVTAAVVVDGGVQQARG